MSWELEKTSEIDKERRSRITACLPVGSRKRMEEEEPNPGMGSKGRRRKKLKYAVMEENWGATEILEQLEEERRKEDREEEQRMVGKEGGGASMLLTIPTPDKGGVGGGVKTPFKDKPAVAIKVLTQPRITLFLEGPANKAKPRAEELMPPMVDIEMVDNTTFEGRVKQGVGVQEDKKEEDNDRKVIVSLPMAENVMKDNTIEGNLEEIATPSMVGQKEKAEKAGYLGKNVKDMGSLEMGDNNSNEGEMLKHDEVLMDNVRKDNNVDGDVQLSGGDEQCVMKRGRCEVHKLKGDKIETTSRKWAKVKHEFGWVTRKTVVWKCSYNNRDTDMGGETRIPIGTVRSQLPDLRTQQGGSDTLGISQIKGREGIRGSNRSLEELTGSESETSKRAAKPD